MGGLRTVEKASPVRLPDTRRRYYRDACESRGISLAIAYIDIDDFRKLNTKYGHVAVDRDVLPLFMRAMESFTFARDYGYRFGGD
ncbi:MAG: hypothetical protein DMG57_06070 [Acidobacteria bacterium]|nr:MAG: hypothetical protein DMG57_06070 [Acidobacteriota bacterium]